MLDQGVKKSIAIAKMLNEVLPSEGKAPVDDELDEQHVDDFDDAAEGPDAQ